MSVSTRLMKSVALEYLEYDSVPFRWALAQGSVLAGQALWARDVAKAFPILSRIHRSGGSKSATRRIEQILAAGIAKGRGGATSPLRTYFDQHIEGATRGHLADALVADPGKLFKYRVIVTRSPRDGERGVIVVDYSYIFPLFAALFDLPAIAERYHIVLEPSWRGLCTADILCYANYDFPVFVQTVEPRDTAFLNALDANFVTVPIAANWWVDHRVVAPVPGTEKDLDVVMVAGWSEVKRHWRFFKVLAGLKADGHRLKVALVGYPQDKKREAIEDEARHFGVRDQLELHEKLPIDQVNRLLTRAKVHVLWSRKEGANRALIEALFADVPVIARQGLGYGYAYPYVNERTGRFATEASLGRTILEVIGAPERFSPRAWALANMSCQQATGVLDGVIGRTCAARGEPWTGGMAIKTVQLSHQQYWDPADAARFEDDYAFLLEHVRRRGTSAPR